MLKYFITTVVCALSLYCAFNPTTLAYIIEQLYRIPAPERLQHFSVFNSEKLHPHVMQRRNNFFEGWYYKMVSADQNTVIAIIPGIFKYGSASHIFTLVLYNEHCYYFKYGAENLKFDLSANGNYNFTFDNNTFTQDFIKFSLHEDITKNVSIHTEGIKFSNLKRWPKTFLSPGVMGPFEWLGFLECYHGVVSMDHDITGTLELNGTLLNFTGGKGYIEKDYGSNFPSTWIWTQANNFETEYPASVFVSVASIPFIGFNFTGYLIGIQVNNSLYSFTTYNGAKITHLSWDNSTMEITVQQLDKKLTVKVELKGKPCIAFGPLFQAGDMVPYVKEYQMAQASVQLELNGNLVFEGKSLASIEVMGEVDTLLNK